MHPSDLLSKLCLFLQLCADVEHLLRTRLALRHRSFSVRHILIIVLAKDVADVMTPFSNYLEFSYEIMCDNVQ